MPVGIDNIMQGCVTVIVLHVYSQALPVLTVYTYLSLWAKKPNMHHFLGKCNSNNGYEQAVAVCIAIK